jgi:glutaredoxin-like YruB-family protein
MVEKKVIMYSLPTCPYCKRAKEYLSQKGINYTDYDVAKDKSKAKEMIKKSNQRGTPVIIVDDEMIIGFDQLKLDKLLG